MTEDWIKPRRPVLKSQILVNAERQTRLLGALHAAALELRGHNECFDDCHTTQDGEFPRAEFAQESEENWNIFGQCIEALTEHGVSIDMPFDEQKPEIKGGVTSRDDRQIGNYRSSRMDERRSRCGVAD